MITMILFLMIMTCAEGLNNSSTNDIHSGSTKSWSDIFDSKKIFENVISLDLEGLNAQTSSTLDYQWDLDPGVTLERDYDFYQDDIFHIIDPIDTSESAEVTVRAGYFPQSSNKRDSVEYDYNYDAKERSYSDHSESYDYGGEYSDHSDYSGGYDDHVGSYDPGYKVQPKKPGPFGYPSPNFKCEKSSETLYVTKTEWTFDKKCFNVYKVKCTEGYDEGKVSTCNSRLLDETCPFTGNWISEALQ